MADSFVFTNLKKGEIAKIQRKAILGKPERWFRKSDKVLKELSWLRARRYKWVVAMQEHLAAHDITVKKSAINKLVWCPPFGANYLVNGKPPRPGFSCEQSRICPWCYARQMGEIAFSVLNVVDDLQKPDQRPLVLFHYSLGHRRPASDVLASGIVGYLKQVNNEFRAARKTVKQHFSTEGEIILTGILRNEDAAVDDSSGWLIRGRGIALTDEAVFRRKLDTWAEVEQTTGVKVPVDEWVRITGDIPASRTKIDQWLVRAFPWWKSIIDVSSVPAVATLLFQTSHIRTRESTGVFRAAAQKGRKSAKKSTLAGVDSQ